MRDSVQVLLQSKPLADDGQEDIRRDGHPHLNADRVLRRAVERLDAQVLFDPFEEELHLPPLLVELRDDERRQVEVVGSCW